MCEDWGYKGLICTYGPREELLDAEKLGEYRPCPDTFVTSRKATIKRTLSQTHCVNSILRQAAMEKTYIALPDGTRGTCPDFPICYFESPRPVASTCTPRRRGPSVSGWGQMVWGLKSLGIRIRVICWAFPFSPQSERSLSNKGFLDERVSKAQLAGPKPRV